MARKRLAGCGSATVLLCLLLVACVGAAPLTLTWDNPPADTATFLEVHRKAERCADVALPFTLLDTTPAPAATYVDATPVDGTRYCYRVRAGNLAGLSDFSNDAEQPLPGSPAAPSNLIVVWSAVMAVASFARPFASVPMRRITTTAHRLGIVALPDDLTRLTVLWDLLSESAWYVDTWTRTREHPVWIYAGGCGGEMGQRMSGLSVQVRRGTGREWRGLLRSRSGMVAQTFLCSTEPIATRPLLPEHHSVAFDNNPAITQGFGVTSVTSPAFTISSSADRAGRLCLGFPGSSTTSAFSGSIGGTGGTAIAGTETSSVNAVKSLMYGVTAPPSGSQTGTMAWTTAATAELTVVTAVGVDQTTPFTDGTLLAPAGFGNPGGLAVTSTSGDLTSTGATQTDTTTTAATDQTLKGGNASSGGDIGPGTGTTTHTWTGSTFSFWAISGANFKAAAAGIAIPVLTRQYRARGE